VFSPSCLRWVATADVIGHLQMSLFVLISNAQPDIRKNMHTQTTTVRQSREGGGGEGG